MNIIDLRPGDKVMYEGEAAVIEEVDFTDNSVYVTNEDITYGGWVYDVENMEKCND